MGIEAQHPQYVSTVTKWKRINDITRRLNLPTYLPTLNPSDTSLENAARNRQYTERAVFYAVAQQTVAGMLGLMFSKDPQIELPKALEYLAANTDGAGISLYQQSQAVADDVLRFSRAGLVVSYPNADKPVSREQINKGEMVAVINRVEPQAITNWRTIQRGAKTVLSLVVIFERVPTIGEDGYTVKHIDQLREMFLADDTTYTERIWQREDNGDKYEAVDEYIPRDARGNTWDVIPFTFVGAENNDAEVDSPNLETLVEINIGHYRNSADWEDTVFYAGQAQPWMSGVDGQTRSFFKEDKLYVGSRNPIMLADGGQFGFASAAPNPIVRQAMLDKIELMVGLGAIMLQPAGQVKTATQVAGEREAQHSVLSMVAGNISDAYTQALEWAMRYIGADGEASYTLNKDFVAPDTSPQELQAIMAGFIQGSMPIADYVRYMQRRGLMDTEKTIDDYGEELTGPVIQAE